jgi:hypothetical protein
LPEFGNATWVIAQRVGEAQRRRVFRRKTASLTFEEGLDIGRPGTWSTIHKRLAFALGGW